MISQARWHQWETNSSSCHSIILDEDISPESLTIPQKLHIEPGEFGWEDYCYDTPEGKASYIWTCLRYTNDDAKTETLRKQFLDSIRSFGIEIDLRESNDDNFWPEGYIDHGNEYLDEILYIVEDNDRLKKFLFHQNSYVHTDNDNY